MPLSDSIYDASKHTAGSESSPSTTSIPSGIDFFQLTAEGSTDFDPPTLDSRLEDLLDADGNIPAGTIIKHVSVIYTEYFREAELLAIDADTGCEYYQVQVEVARFIDHYVVFGPVDYFYLRVADGRYQLRRYIRNCPQTGIELTGYHEMAAINADQDDPSVEARGEQLFEEVEGTTEQTNPPPSIPQGGNQAPPQAPQGGGLRLWLPPEILPRLIAAHGYTEAFDEGNDHILKEYLWRAGPSSINGCVMTVTYIAIVRTSRWTLNPANPPDVVHGAAASQIIAPVEPRLVKTERISIPGCDPSNPLGRRG